METVKFQCGHCRNLMAVGTEFLGQQVRCPHCQQVVVAPQPQPQPQPQPEPVPVATNPFPPPPDPGPAEMPFRPAAVSDHEDIFSPPEEPDDLFGRPSTPRLEVPPPDPVPPAVNGATAAPELPAAAAPEPQFGSTLAYVPPDGSLPPTEPGGSSEPAAPPGAFHSWMEAPTVPDAPPPPEPVPAEFTATAPYTPPAPVLEAPPPAEETAAELPVSVPSVRRTPRDTGGGWFIPLVFVPLVFYAIGASFFVGWSIWKLNQLSDKGQQNPFNQLPDDGDDRGVKQNDKRISFKVKYDDRFATAALPAAQRLRLGETRRFGEIEVTPERLERKKVAVMVLGHENPEKCQNESLVLWLKFRNVSADQAFAPLDNYFDRWWQPGSGPMPLTQLEAGKHRFCGGPAKWYPHTKKNEKPEWVKGRKYSDPEGLKAGGEAEGFVCTDGDDSRAARVLFGDPEGQAAPHPGPFLWRVQVRRGLITWKGHDHSATTVIGVEFGRDDIPPRAG